MLASSTIALNPPPAPGANLAESSGILASGTGTFAALLGQPLPLTSRPAQPVPLAALPPGGKILPPDQPAISVAEPAPLCGPATTTSVAQASEADSVPAPIAPVASTAVRAPSGPAALAARHPEPAPVLLSDGPQPAQPTDHAASEDDPAQLAASVTLNQRADDAAAGLITLAQPLVAAGQPETTAAIAAPPAMLLSGPTASALPHPQPLPVSARPILAAPAAVALPLNLAAVRDHAVPAASLPIAVAVTEAGGPVLPAPSLPTLAIPPKAELRPSGAVQPRGEPATPQVQRIAIDFPQPMAPLLTGADRAELPVTLLHGEQAGAVLPALAAPRQLAPAPAPLDFQALIDRIEASRDAVGATPVTLSVLHKDFGPVGLRFEARPDQLSIGLSNPDPDFARAVTAAQAAPPAAGPAVQASTDGPRQDPPGRSQHSADGAQQQAGHSGSGQSGPFHRDTAGGRPGQARRPDPDTPNGRTGRFA